LYTRKKNGRSTDLNKEIERITKEKSYIVSVFHVKYKYLLRIYMNPRLKETIIYCSSILSSSSFVRFPSSLRHYYIHSHLDEKKSKKNKREKERD